MAIERQARRKPRKPMDSETLRFFLRVSELGSFGRAAQSLNISQPTLSRRIALLEREVRAQVFVRHQRGVSLTANEHAAAVIVSDRGGARERLARDAGLDHAIEIVGVNVEDVSF